MTARDDYRLLAGMEQRVSERSRGDYTDALDEIDRLRHFAQAVTDWYWNHGTHDPQAAQLVSALDREIRDQPMTARDDHQARVIRGVSEPECWAALFDTIDRLRAIIAAMRAVLEDDR